MSLYARADLAAVTVSVAHGGCNQTHHRPANDGKPAPVWELDCAACSDFLRHDSNWSTTLAELPETYDRRLERERDEKMGKLDRENQLAEALIALQNLGQLPAAFSRVVESITGTPANAVAGSTVCPEGHENKAGHKFCAECGAPMHAAGPAIEPPAPAPADGSADEADLSGLHWKKLEKLCKDRGLDATGSKAELVARLQNESVAA